MKSFALAAVAALTVGASAMAQEVSTPLPLRAVEAPEVVLVVVVPVEVVEAVVPACTMIRIKRPGHSMIQPVSFLTIYGVSSGALEECAKINEGHEVSDVVGIKNSGAVVGAVRVSFHARNPYQGVRVWVPSGLASFAATADVCRADGATDKYAAEWHGDTLPDEMDLRDFGRTPAQVEQAQQICKILGVVMAHSD